MTKGFEELTFSSDTKLRKRFFTSESFAHPAKMHLSLQMYLIEHYTKIGETILDPMGGSGTLLMATTIGRNVIIVELEEKFVKMANDNWRKIQRLGPMLGYTMGTATILQGDARDLQVLADKVVFSPPYAETEAQVSADKFANPERFAKVSSQRFKEGKKKGHFASKEAILRGMEKTQKGCGENPNNISNLPYGKIDTVISSPPYSESPIGGGLNTKPPREGKKDQSGRNAKSPSQKGAGTYDKADAIISSPPHGNRLSDDACKDNDPQRMSYRQSLKADYICTSPPYEGSIVGNEETPFNKKRLSRMSEKQKRNWRKKMSQSMSQLHAEGYSVADNNIGNMKGDNYLTEMLKVYRQCHSVLRDGGLMCIVVKNFIRDKKIVRLDLDTIKLCETAGFTLKERLARKLTQQSFWRRIYEQRYPDAPKIELEDVLIFEKKTGKG